jgi:hypothetical protein
MRKILPAFAGLLTACSTPAYRAPEVPVPSTYSVTSVSPVPADQRGASEDIPTSAIHVSTALASAPFWSRVLRVPGRHGDSPHTIWCRR